MVEYKFKEKYNVSDLVEIMRLLRSPGGCVWDREQDHKSIRRSFIEETYEAVEAIDNDDPVLLSEELGDLLFAAVNVARFLKTDPEQAIANTTDKFIRRFAQVEQAAHEAGRELSDMTLAEMDALWDAVKAREHGDGA